MQVWACSPFNAQRSTCLWVCNLCVRLLGLNLKMHIILSSDELKLVLNLSLLLFSLWEHLLLLFRHVHYGRCVLRNASDRQLRFLVGHHATQCCAVCLSVWYCTYKCKNNQTRYAMHLQRLHVQPLQLVCLLLSSA